MDIPNSDVRRELDRLLDYGLGRSVEHIPGIVKLEERDYRKDYNDDFRCWEYALGIEEPEDDSWPIEGFSEIEKPIPGDLAVYFSIQKWGELREHVGVCEKNSKIRSKWGTGHVYLHNLAVVPAGYGTIVKFYRRTNGTSS